MTERSCRRISVCLAVVCGVILLFVCPLIRAQVSRASSGGSIAGKIVGPGQVAVPGARVILFNIRTRARKETWSDTAGSYLFNDVPPGQYRLIVMLVGFRPSLLGPVEVTTGKPASLDATLALAQPGEPTGFGNFGRGRAGAGQGNSASTASRPGQPGTRSRAGQGAQQGQYAQRGGGAARGQFNPQGAMNSGAGNDLSSIMAGADEGGGATGAGLRFSGAAGGEGTGEQGDNGAAEAGGGAAGAGNSFVLTGQTVDASAPAMRRGGRGRFIFGGGPGGPGGQAGVPFGGEGGGGRVFFFGGMRRPGVNRLRGNFFDSYTNAAFDARPYALNTPPQPKEPFYNERVGFNVGGPLIIPKIYNGGNKTSFFINYNTTRATTPENLLASVPTQAERQGDFSNTLITAGPGAGTMPVIYQPSAGLGPRTPFPNNVIPSAMLNSASLGLLKYVPPPNLPGQVQNYHVQLSLPTQSQMIMGRIDHQISNKDNLAVMYFYDSSHANGVTGYQDITSTTTTRRQNLSVTETHNFGPRMINNAAFNFNRSRNFTTNPFALNQNIAGALGIQGVSADPLDWGLPSIGFTNFSGLSDANPSLTRDQTFRFDDFLFYNLGKHNFQIGGEISKIQLNSLTNPSAEGTFSFTGYSTSNFTAQGAPVAGSGYDFADFLLGLPQTTSEQFGIPANYLRSSRYSLYGNDDWRTTNHLTLDLGGRWEYAAPFTEKYGHLSDLTLGPGFSTAGVVTGRNPGNLPASLLHGHPYNVTPRVGIAYRPWITHSLVVRAGYGIFYDESVYQSLVQDLVNQAPFATTSILVTNPAQVLTLQNGFPALSSSTVRNTFAVDPNFLTPYAQSWNVMLEQDLSQSYVLSAAYIGTRGTHLNLLIAPNIAVTGTGQVLVTNALPFEYDTSGASSLYNGLRITLRHFSRRNFSFFLNYTYSKAEDNASSVGGRASSGGFFRFGGGSAGSAIVAAVSPLPPVQNPFNLAAEWALSGFNPTHELRAFSRYQLPFGDREPFLNHGGPLARVLGNWSLSDITSYGSGNPYTAFVAGNASNNVNGLAPFGGLRADATGLPVTLGESQRSTLDYFNTAAFAVPPAGEFGNAGRNTIPGLPSLNFNIGLDRDITISRERNMRLNLRVATNNTFNIVNFTSLSTVINSNTFGRISGVGSMRTVTLSLRFRF